MALVGLLIPSSTSHENTQFSSFILQHF